MMSFGAPSGLDEVKPFLERVMKGRPLSPERVDEMVARYREIGGASPLPGAIGAQAEAVERELNEAGSPKSVYVAMCNWHPFIRDTLSRMADRGVRRATGLIMAPHRSEASTGRYEREVEAAREELGDRIPAVEFPGSWHDDPLFIDAVCDRVGEALERIPEGERGDTPWVFTAHSIPLAQARESTYVQDVSRTIEMVAERFSPPRWRLAYQSRSGSPETPWLGPDVAEAVAEETGAPGVLLVPVGFVSDNVEIVYDLDRAAASVAHGAGLKYYRAGTVGDHPSFIRMLARIARESR